MGDLGADGVAAGPQGNWDLHVEKRFEVTRWFVGRPTL